MASTHFQAGWLPPALAIRWSGQLVGSGRVESGQMGPRVSFSVIVGCVGKWSKTVSAQEGIFDAIPLFKENALVINAPQLTDGRFELETYSGFLVTC